jgi:hypothetical protein
VAKLFFHLTGKRGLVIAVAVIGAVLNAWEYGFFQGGNG